MWPGLSATLSSSIILPGLLQTIYLMSVPISLKNKGWDDSCWKVGKDCAWRLQRFQSIWEAAGKPLHSLIDSSIFN